MSQVIDILSEINAGAQHVTLLINNMIQKCKNGQFSTNEGLSFLDMKNNTLLSYLINIADVLLFKCTGQKIENNPCITRLIELRAVLEKISPIDNKLKYEIDKLVKIAAGNSTNADDRLAHKANIENFQEDTNEDDENNGIDKNEIDNIKSDKYVPPKLSAQHYKDFETVQEMAKRKAEHKKKSILSASILQDLREEYLDTPIEISDGNRAQQKFLKEQKEREEYEEEYFTRLPVSKAEKYRRRQLTTVGTLGENITNFSSEMKSGSRKRKAGKSGKFVKSKGKRRKFQ